MTVVMIPEPDWSIFDSLLATESVDEEPLAQPYWRSPFRSTRYFLRSDIHLTIKGHYTMDWCGHQGWCFDFEDRDDALLFKLRYGGK